MEEVVVGVCLELKLKLCKMMKSLLSKSVLRQPSIYVGDISGENPTSTLDEAN